MIIVYRQRYIFMAKTGIIDPKARQIPSSVDSSGPSESDSSKIQDAPASPAFHHSAFKRNQLWTLIPVLLLLVAGMGVVIMSLQKNQDVRSRATDTGSTLALAPSSETGAVGTTFSLGATLNTNADSVSAAALSLTYDPTAVQIVSFTPGTVLTVQLIPETHENGTISVTLGAQPSSPYKGADIVGTWQIKILAAKQSSISFASTTQVAAVGKTTNALITATGASITGTSTTTTTPTPTPIGTNTPTPTPKQGGTPTPTPRAPTPTATPRPGVTVTPTPIITTATSFGQIAKPTSPPTQTQHVYIPPVAQPTAPSAIVPIIQTQTQQTTPIIPPATPTPVEIPKTTVFQRVLSGIVAFFQKLFQK